MYKNTMIVRKHLITLSIAITLIMIFNIIHSNTLVKAAGVTVTTSPSSLTENNLNNAKIVLKLSIDQYVDQTQLGPEDFVLNNSPTRTTILKVTRDSNTQATITLSFDGTDFDTNVTNFSVTILPSGIISGTTISTDPITITAIIETGTASSNPSTLSETNLNGAQISIKLSSELYVSSSSLGVEDFILNNPPTGTAISSVSRNSNNEATITLSFDGTDFDVNIPDFSVTVLGSGIVGGSSVNTNALQIKAVLEPTNAIIITTPSNLCEFNLNCSILNLTISGDTFNKSITTSNFVLNNAPAGMSIASVNRINDKSVNLTLSFDGTDFDTDITNFSVTALETGLSGKVPIASNVITIKAVQEVEGNHIYTITGESYPTNVQITGYNTRNKNLFVNFTLHTTKSVDGTHTANFKYFIEVFDNSSNYIGSNGSLQHPLIISAQKGLSDIIVSNSAITLNSAIPASYRIVITVIAVDIV